MYTHIYTHTVRTHTHTHSHTLHTHTHIPEEVGGGCGWPGILSLSVSPSLRRTRRRSRRGRKRRRKRRRRRQSLLSRSFVPTGGGGSDPLQGRAAGRLLVACEPQRLLGLHREVQTMRSPGLCGSGSVGGPGLSEVLECRGTRRDGGLNVSGVRQCWGSGTDGGPGLSGVRLPTVPPWPLPT